MRAFITNQKKLAAAAGISAVHLSRLKRGRNGISEGIAERLEELTGIKKLRWAGSGRSDRLAKDLDRFFVREKQMEEEAIQRRFSN